MSELPVPAVARPTPSGATPNIQSMAGRAPGPGASSPAGTGGSISRGTGVNLPHIAGVSTPRSTGATPAQVGLADVAPLFRFMRIAEQRFDTLRMTIVDRRFGARGDTVGRADVWVRHPGTCRVVVGEMEGPSQPGPSQAIYEAWVIDGGAVTHYDADANVVRSRPHLPIPRGADIDHDLPAFGRVYYPLTPLPAGTLADTFVHPHGFCRNVLATGRLSLPGIVTGAAGREMTLVRCDHPRSAKVLVDRPDRWLLVGADRATGLLLLLEEHMGDEPTRRAEVTALALDEPMGDEIFTLHVSDGVRRLY